MSLQWQFLLSNSELESFLEEKEVKAVTVNGKQLCIAKYNNEYYALDDRCPHAGGSLRDGWCDLKGNVICPYHRYGFRVKDGGPASGKGYYVDSYPLELKEDGLYVGFKKKWWQF